MPDMKATNNTMQNRSVHFRFGLRLTPEELQMKISATSKAGDSITCGGLAVGLRELTPITSHSLST